jgi:TPR repeat protein
MTELETQAKANDPRAMLILGSLYERGLNATPKRNYGKALEWFQKAADLDSPEAYYYLGVYHEIGMGTAPDMKKALANYQKAADKGLPIAELKLASVYLNGDGAAKDLPKGFGLLESAANKNLPQALMDLGVVYYYGNFDKKRDLTKARELFQKAADLGVPNAMLNLGVMALAGEGMEANKTLGLRWYLLAQRYGINNPEMQTTIDGIKADLKPAEITQAEEDANKWADDYRAKVEAAQAANLAAQQAASETAATPPAPK